MLKQNSYTSEVKELAAKLANEFDQPIAATAREGVSANVLDTWVGKYLKPKQAAERTDEDV